MNIRPIGDRILLKAVERDSTQGGILIPHQALGEPQEYKVIKIGTGIIEKGKTHKFIVEVGDTVIINKYTGTEIKYDSEKYLLLNEGDVLAIVKK